MKQKKPILILITPKLHKKIRAKAKEQNRTFTGLIEYVMKRYCNEL